MATEPLVFIILVNWNGREITLECLASLHTISYKNFKVVVVDNGSSDDSVPAIARKFPGVVILEMRENLRFAEGNNAGIRYALEHGAELVLLLNNDTVVDKDFLSRLVENIQSDSAIGMVAPKIYYHDDPGRIWFAGGELSMWAGTLKHIGIREVDTGQYNSVREILYASGCCLLTRTEVINRIGMLDKSFFMYTEDADWCMRCRQAGFRIYYEPRARVWHKLSVSSGGHLSWFKMKNKFVSNIRFFARYAAWYHWLVFPWMNLLANGVAAARYVVTAKFRK